MEMKKGIALATSLMLMISSLPAFARAEAPSGGDPAMEMMEAATETFDPAQLVIHYLPGDGTQAALSYAEGAAILTEDGLQFKDLNRNGRLDGYEDWRNDTETRVADLLERLSAEEKASFLIQSDMPKVVGTAENESTETAWYYTSVLGISHMLDNNGSGTPDAMANRHNGVQAAAEATPHGIPVTVTSDRQYNAWAGYMDTAHDAIGTAHDVALEQAILSAYAKESAATGIHVTLQPFGVEIGSWYGENPAYIAELTVAEIEAYQSNGVFTCVKHFITRGGDQSFATGRSIAANVDNYMYSWKAAVDAGTRWIMTNSAGEGLDGLNIDFSRESMAYLRDTLGYDGVVVTDWGSIGYAAKGIDADGVDLSTLSNAERYAYEINNGVDQLGINNVTLDASRGNGSTYCLADVYTAVNSGFIPMERVDEAVARLLRTKFDLDLFENPYRDPAQALALAANEAFVQESWELNDMDALAAARNADLVELERQLQAASTVLVKNEGGILPMQRGTKVYIGSTNGGAVEEYKKQLARYAEVVDTLEDAEVVIADCARMDDAAELLVEDAAEAGKPLVIVANCVDPDAWMIEHGTAVLFMNFTRVPDHGTAKDGFIFTTEPVVYAELLFGDREPTGIIVKEIARDSDMDLAQWKDLAGDQGAGMDVRMLIEAIMLSSEDHSTPNNYGDPLLQYQYGMRYGQEASFRYSTLVVPTELKEVSVHLFLDFYETQLKTVNAVQKAGEPFTIYCIVWNDGSDGIENVQILDQGSVVAEKTMAVTGGSWRILKTEIVLSEAGEHVISIGDQCQTITVE